MVEFSLICAPPNVKPGVEVGSSAATGPAAGEREDKRPHFEEDIGAHMVVE